MGATHDVIFMSRLWVESSPSLFGKADVQAIQGANDSNLRDTGHWQRNSRTTAQADAEIFCRKA